MKRIFLAGVMLFLILGATNAAQAQSTAEYYEAETGHYIRGQFLEFYKELDNKMLYLGYPITREFTDPVRNLRVQYFQRGRLETVNTEQGLTVARAQLGRFMYDSKAKSAGYARDEVNCERFAGDVFICFGFLGYYRNNNGPDLLGLPLADAQVENGRTVQYFEYSRLEWWPEKPLGQQFVLSSIGRYYFDKFVSDSRLTAPELPGNIIVPLRKPNAMVFASKALIGTGEKQEVFVVVLDRYKAAVEGAQVQVTFYQPDGTQQTLWAADTDADGITSIPYEVGPYAQRQVVEVDVEIITPTNERAVGNTWFRIWW
jgi:hypothetical protein